MARPSSATEPAEGPSVSAGLLERSAKLLTRIPTAPWNFGDSIGLEAMVTASQALGDPRLLGYAHGFVRGWVDSGRDYRPLDCTAPGRAMCEIAEQTGDMLVLEAAERLARDHLSRRRRVAGILATWERSPLQHPLGPHPLVPAQVELVVDPGAGVFVDCLHFDPPLFAALGRILASTEWFDHAGGEASHYCDLLQDDGGLFHHFHLERTGQRYVLGWGRGQGWALLGLLDVLDDLPATHPDRCRLVAAARALTHAMLACQRGDGHWTAMVHDPASGVEASTAAFMSVAFRRALATGVVSDEEFEVAASRALLACLRDATTDGLLNHVSAAVGACTSPSHYAHVPRGFLVHWGQGAFVLALAMQLALGTGS